MARQIDYDAANALLKGTFPLAEDDYRESSAIEVPEKICTATDVLFVSETQAYREALIGCAIARILDSEIDIRLPATEFGENSFSGRGLADRVVTPFMRNKSVPISASPYLSSLRGGARFIDGGEPRIQRDKAGYAALVAVVAYLKDLDIISATLYLRYLLRQFIKLRDSANIILTRVAKLSLEQLSKLTLGLLDVKSGGRFPSFLATAMFQTLNECHKLGWQVDFQGINVADKASGAVGDITIQKDGKVILGVEVTERPIEGARVILTFEQKVSPAALTDYLFLSTAQPAAEAIAAAKSYTAAGHEMNFMPIQTWLRSILGTIGPDCRILFQDKMIALIGLLDVPADLKIAWNGRMDSAIGIGATAEKLGL
ncbi:MAG TPA: restriction endonuclease, SacI family [Rhizomicrobium sp.]|jgi:hypothetical protein|nr:restriction endonuclease, SacI family [Rhizomicrobium sp.]